MVLKNTYITLSGLFLGVMAGVAVFVSVKDFTLSVLSAVLCFAALNFFLRKSNSKDKPGLQTYNLRNSKDVLYEGAANHFVNNKQVSGFMYLLKDRLVFQSKSFKVALKHEVILELKNIKEVSFAKTNHLLDKIIVIVTKTGDERFLVKGHQLWIDEIENALHNFELANKVTPINKHTLSKKNTRRNRAV